MAVERDTIFVVSDVHIGSKHFSHEKQKSKFWDFLEEVGNNERARELILNGDIIETWASPIEEVYPIEKIFEHEDVVTFSHFVRFVVEKGVEVVYIIGNHDSRVTEASIHALLGTDVKVLYTYVKYGIHFSHGHRYDYFNSTDPVGAASLPIGYYATRVDFNHEIGFSHERRDNLRNTMHKVLPDLTKSRAIVSEKVIISSFMTHMWFKSSPLLSLWKTGMMPRIVNEKNEPETMSMISNRLYPLYQAWAASNTDDYVAATMRCSMTAEYSWFIESGQYGQVSHVVHGHTHNGLVQTYPTAWGDITYVNNGAWEWDRMNFAKFVLTPQLTVDSCELVTMYNN